MQIVSHYLDMQLILKKILFLNNEVLITNKESQKSVFSAVKMKTFFP